MLFIKKIVDLIGISVNLPMIIEINNKGTKDLMNNWRVGCRTRIDIRYFYICDLKEKGIIQIELIRSEDNFSDLFTKNLGKKLYEKHAAVFCE
jgi:hypothetical protein